MRLRDGVDPATSGRSVDPVVRRLRCDAQQLDSDRRFESVPGPLWNHHELSGVKFGRRFTIVGEEEDGGSSLDDQHDLLAGRVALPFAVARPVPDEDAALTVGGQQRERIDRVARRGRCPIRQKGESSEGGVNGQRTWISLHRSNVRLRCHSIYRGGMGDATDDLANLWRWFGETQCRGYSPIYERIAEVVAANREILELFREAPPAAHMPPAPLGAVRYLLLDGLDHPLGDVYAGRSDADPGPLFVDLCRSQRDHLLAVLETRRVQTNDCGRSALIGPALTWVATQLPGPYSLVDVGTSAGINLLCDRYRLDYGHHGFTGPADSSVRINCEIKGGVPPIADRLPDLAQRLGIDLSPIDLSNPADAQWLLACVWPDTGRAERVEASIRLAQSDLPSIVTGRANEVLSGVLAGLPTDGTIILTTTWAFGYFSIEERAAFVELLRTESEHRRIAWVSAEGAGTVDELTPLGGSDSSGPDTLGAVLFERGASTPHLLAQVHGHGNWIDWRAPA